MSHTTIAVSSEVKEKTMRFGNKKETYSQIISKLIESAKKRHLQDLLMNEENTTLIGEAINRSKKKWLK